MADSRKIALDYLKANQVTFPIILDSTPAGWKAMNQYLALPDLGADPMTYVIGRDGKILKRFESKVKPDSEEMVQAVEGALATK